MKKPLLASFQLQKHRGEIEQALKEKILLSSEILRSPPGRVMTPDLLHSRTRFDVMCLNGEFGLRGPSQENGEYSFTPLPEMDTVDPVIEEMMIELRTLSMPLKLAQLRLRTNAKKEKGLWIDMSNEAIKDLLDEATFLTKLLERNYILEMGQKHKSVDRDENGALKLLPPRAHTWLSTFSKDNEDIEILSYASLFSQPGPEANRALFAAAFELLDGAGLRECTWAEWGAGYGNLTLAFATRLGARGAWASEMDAAASDLLSENIARFAPAIRCENRTAKDVHEAFDLWLADPPRNGFPELFKNLHSLAPATKPRWILLFSCHSKGLLSDSALIKAAHYRLHSWSLVDIFPATPYSEVLSLWERPTP